MSKVNLDDIYESKVLSENINLSPKDTNYNIDEIIKKKLADKVEGKCVKEGYVRPGSIEIISRSSGHLINSDFTGKTNYVITFKADVCILSDNQIITCEVFNVDKSSVICYVGDPSVSPVELYLYKQHHIGNIDYANLKPEHIVKIKIVKSRFEFKYTQIRAIGELVEKVSN